jgi:hypothetical protein
MNSPTEPIAPDRPPIGGRRVKRTGVGIFLITSGAILRFALPAGSPHGLNVHIVGVILILAGVLQLVMPAIVRASHHPERLRRWVRPSQAQVYVEPSAGEDRDHSDAGR